MWPTAGHDLDDARHARTETKIAPDTVAELAVRWVTNTDGDVTATPSVDGTSLYVPDAAGNVYRIDRDSGAVAWATDLAALTGVPGNASGTTPALHDGVLVVGDQGGRTLAGARVLALDRATGAPLWSTLVDAHPSAVIAQSPVVFAGRVLVGVASLEDVFALDPSYPCCTFRGSVVALDVDTGAILWRTFMAPVGYSGAPVRGGTPAVDPRRRALYVTTGHNYGVPSTVSDCVLAHAGDDAAVAACVAPDDLFDALVALDLDSGAVRWSVRTTPFDAWTAACLAGPQSNCPAPAGDGHGFAQGAMRFRARFGQGPPRELVGAGLPSGAFWSLDADTGSLLWTTRHGPGGSPTGLDGGSAVDGERIYVVDANADGASWIVASGATTDRGIWSGLDVATGEVLWQKAEPGTGIGGSLHGPLTVANGVTFSCSLDANGPMYALDAADGALLWSFASGEPCLGGAAVVGGAVYWASGADATPGGSVYAFELPN